MGHYDNEGLSGITKGKGKGKKSTGKGFGKQFQGYCNTCGMWVTKQLTATRWHQGNKGKGPGKKVEQRDSRKAKAKE